MRASSKVTALAAALTVTLSGCGHDATSPVASPATSNGPSGLSVTVNAPPAIITGIPVEFAPVETKADGSPFQSRIAYTSSDPNVASVIRRGNSAVLMGLVDGTVTITVEAVGGAKATAIVKVVSSPPETDALHVDAFDLKLLGSWYSEDYDVNYWTFSPRLKASGAPGVQPLEIIGARITLPETGASNACSTRLRVIGGQSVDVANDDILALPVLQTSPYPASARAVLYVQHSDGTIGKVTVSTRVGSNPATDIVGSSTGKSKWFCG